MHELSVTQSILEISLRHRNKPNAKRVTDIYLLLGQLSYVVDHSVQFYWDMIAKDTIAEGATLHFKRVLAEFLCSDCIIIIWGTAKILLSELWKYACQARIRR